MVLASWADVETEVSLKKNHSIICPCGLILFNQGRVMSELASVKELAYFKRVLQF